MPVRGDARRRLSGADWTAAALQALAEGGLAAVAIEPLAARLGATKGSAYWHFPNRESLLAATLARWEVEHTEALVEELATEPDPARRLRRLFTTVMEYAATTHTVELALLASADDPQVAPVLRRVTERRVRYVAELYRELGYPAAQARWRALLAYTAYLGHAQLARTAPQTVPASRAARRAYLDDMLGALQGDGS